MEGKFFIRVNVNDLAQIKALGLWTRIKLPQQASDVTTPFASVLAYLDPADRSDLGHEITE